MPLQMALSRHHRRKPRNSRLARTAVLHPTPPSRVPSCPFNSVLVSDLDRPLCHPV